MSKEYSKWGLLDKIFQTKKDYYAGNPSLLDQEYDALEHSFIVIHGKATLDEWYSVGYDSNKHQIIKNKFEIEKRKARGF